MNWYMLIAVTLAIPLASTGLIVWALTLMEMAQAFIMDDDTDFHNMWITKNVLSKCPVIGDFVKYSTDGADMFMCGLVLLFVGLGLGLAWPATIVLGIVIGILFGLRTKVRKIRDGVLSNPKPERSPFGI